MEIFSKMKQETLLELQEYKKRARFVLMKLHKEAEKKDEEIKILMQVNDILRARVKRLEGK